MWSLLSHKLVIVWECQETILPQFWIFKDQKFNVSSSLKDCILLRVENGVWIVSLILAPTEGPDEDGTLSKHWLKIWLET